MISFIHSGDASMASYRYRCQIPAKELGAEINDLSADILVFAKPRAEELPDAKRRKAEGATIIADFCDDHFDKPHYREFLEVAHYVTCPTETMFALIEGSGRDAWIIPDPYEYPEVEPHCDGVNLLWFGHGQNLKSLLKMIRDLDDYPLMIVSNHPMAMPWSREEMIRQFAKADIVILPKTEEYKSPNRAVESIRQGCYVVAEPHPALLEIPGIWLGNIKEGIEWARLNPQSARQETKIAQNFIRERFSPRTQASAWKSLFEQAKSVSTSVLAKPAGPDGLALMQMGSPT